MPETSRAESVGSKSMTSRRPARRHSARSGRTQIDSPVQTGHKRSGRRHVIVASASAVIGWVFWLSRPNWVAEMRLWKAAGDTAYVLLLAGLALGPVATIWPSARPWLRWRRQIGIWFALVATLHGVLILNGWARWGLRRFLGYEFVPQLGREARLEPGFGLANLIGAVALVLALILAATSSDRALRTLGRPAWSWLHRLAQTVLVLGGFRRWRNDLCVGL